MDLSEFRGYHVEVQTMTAVVYTGTLELEETMVKIYTDKDIVSLNPKWIVSVRKAALKDLMVPSPPIHPRSIKRTLAAAISPGESNTHSSNLSRPPRCHICLGTIQAGRQVLMCACEKTFHVTCSNRVNECPNCGRQFSEAWELTNAEITPADRNTVPTPAKNILYVGGPGSGKTYRLLWHASPDSFCLVKGEIFNPHMLLNLLRLKTLEVGIDDLDKVANWNEVQSSLYSMLKTRSLNIRQGGKTEQVDLPPEFHIRATATDTSKIIPPLLDLFVVVPLGMGPRSD